MKYYISDWAGNSKLDYYGVFNSVDDAINALYDEFSDLEGKELEDQIGEFQVNVLEYNYE